MGPRMLAVASYVAEHPGCLMLDAARHVGPHGSLRYGYRSVHRAIRAGLVRRIPGSRKGTYMLLPNCAGQLDNLKAARSM